MRITFVILFFIFFCIKSSFSYNIELNGFMLYDDLETVEKVLKVNSKKSEKCKKNYCDYRYKYKIKNPIYFTNYEIVTNSENKIIAIKQILFDNKSLETPFKFEKWYSLYGITNCQTGMKFGKDYLKKKYKVKTEDFVEIFSEGVSNNPFEYKNILIHQIKLYLDSGNKLFEIGCRYSRSDDDKWIISIEYFKLMTKNFHEAFEEHFPNIKIDKFNGYDIKSFLFPPSY